MSRPSTLPLLAVVFQLFLRALQLQSQQVPQCQSSSSGTSGSKYCHESLCETSNISTTLQVENLSYVGAVSQLTVKVDPNVTNNTLYYILCAYYPGDFPNGELIDCGAAGNVYGAMYLWTEAGTVSLSATIYNGSYNTSYFSCANTTATIAKNSYIGLRVIVVQNETDHLLAGNVTFVPFLNVTEISNTTTFKYDFGDQSDLVVDTGPNITHWYKSGGHYSYTVDAFVEHYNYDWAYHARYEDSITVLEEVANISIAVSEDNSVQVGSTKNITITALGSFPISVCWYVRNLTQPSASSIDPIETCLNLSVSSTAMHEMDFNQTGLFSFVAVFQNEVNTMNGTFNFTVYPAPAPPPIFPVVSSTAVGVLAVLIAVVVIIIVVIVGFVLPYRRYKRRMTETANFRFVDLSESGSHHWEKFKTKVEIVAGNFRRRSDDKNSGLVNFDERSPLNRSRQFSQHEDL